ncbi:Beta-galactosidase C-terminal domain [Paraglaciecola aquimarina]
MQRDNLTFIFNYSGNTLTFPTEAAEKLGRFVVGKAELAPYDVAVIEHQ